MPGPCTICGSAAESDATLCSVCAALLRWVRGYFAHVPGLAETIGPETRFMEDLGVESLDWMNWPVEAEEKLAIVLPDDPVLERMGTVGDWLRVLREAGAECPADREVQLLPRTNWTSSYRWIVVERKRIIE